MRTRHQTAVDYDFEQPDDLEVRLAEDRDDAFRDAFRALSSRERNVLRLSCVRGLSTDRIGTLFGVNPATADRWLSRARRRIVQETSRLLCERLGVSDAELERVSDVVDRGLDVTLSRVLS